MSTFLMLLGFLTYSYLLFALDNLHTWYKYERKMPIQYQTHRKWWKI
ncbi:hypothetical protein [Niallia circulans]|nr:hypothetical protein [Niallia circulans]